MSDLRRTNAMELLNWAEAGRVEHLSDTLLEHLVRAEELLRQWGASDEVAVAGLCHAIYGTDGFPVAFRWLCWHWTAETSLSIPLGLIPKPLSTRMPPVTEGPPTRICSKGDRTGLRTVSMGERSSRLSPNCRTSSIFRWPTKRTSSWEPVDQAQCPDGSKRSMATSDTWPVIRSASGLRAISRPRALHRRPPD